jgi:hypothetical protein
MRYLISLLIPACFAASVVYNLFFGGVINFSVYPVRLLKLPNFPPISLFSRQSVAGFL